MYISTPVDLMKSSMKGSHFRFQTWKFQEHPKSFHFRVTKKDTDFPFHFHVLNLFKSWSNRLGFDQDSNGHKNSEENQKNEKPKHIGFLCHIVSIQVN